MHLEFTCFSFYVDLCSVEGHVTSSFNAAVLSTSLPFTFSMKIHIKIRCHYCRADFGFLSIGLHCLSLLQLILSLIEKFMYQLSPSNWVIKEVSIRWRWGRLVENNLKCSFWPQHLMFGVTERPEQVENSVEKHFHLNKTLTKGFKFFWICLKTW